jgi:tight adherence protein C
MTAVPWILGLLVAAAIVGPNRPTPRGRTTVVTSRRTAAFPHPLAGRRHRRERDDAIAGSLPELIDLLSLGVAAGLTLRHSAEAVVGWLPPPYDQAIDRAMERSQRGEPWADALAGAARELGPSTQYVFSMLIAAERDGAPVAPALRRASDEARRRRRTRAEERVRRIPVLMLFPLVFCILPAFALLTVVPLLVGTLRDLQLP